MKVIIITDITPKSLENHAQKVFLLRHGQFPKGYLIAVSPIIVSLHREKNAEGVKTVSR